MEERKNFLDKIEKTASISAADYLILYGEIQKPGILETNFDLKF